MKREKNIPPNRRILTIPNLLTLFRLILIPVIAWLYCARQDYAMAAAMLVLSGVTDVADGYIARHFNMISDLGKMLDPVADKLTQFVMLLCLFSRFPAMLLPSILMVIKECIAAVTGLCVIHKTGNVYGSVWHGKLATCLLYLMMFIHILWPGIPAAVSNTMIAICMLVMLLSLVLYCIRNVHLMQQGGKTTDKT